MALKDFIRKMVPKQLLDWNRERKKDAQRLILAAQRDAGNVLTNGAVYRHNIILMLLNVAFWVF